MSVQRRIGYPRTPQFASLGRTRVSNLLFFRLALIQRTRLHLNLEYRFALTHPIEFTAVFGGVPVRGLIGMDFESEEIFAAEAQEEPHGGYDQKEKEGEEHFAHDLAEMKTDRHAGAVETAKPEGADQRHNEG